MIGAYDEWGNVVDLVEWEAKIRAEERLKLAYEFNDGYQNGRADAIDDFQEWLKTQVVGIDNSTKEILVVVDNRWELAIEKYKEQKNDNDRRRNG